MSIRVQIQEQVYQQNFDNLLRGSTSETLGTYKGVPSGNFTEVEGDLTQFSAAETSFQITTDSPGEVHTIRATLISNEFQNNTLKFRNRIVEKQFVPVNTVVTVAIALLKGENQIDVFTANDSTFTTVIASHAGTFLTTYARELFTSTQNPLNEQTRALFSNFSSRMTEILIPFQDLYADPKSLRTLISRFVTRAYMTKSGSTDGVRDFAAALLGTTPIFTATKTDQTVFEPAVVPLYRSQLEFGGYEAHAWIPNFEIVHWLSFLRLIDNARHFYTIEEVGESEILVTAGGVQETHRFNFDDPFATAYSEFTFTDFRIVIEVLDKLNITFCAAGYPFDLFVTQTNPLGQKRITFDSGVNLDSGDTFDAPALDPGDDGWVGLTLSGRFDNYKLNANPFQLALDSLFVIPSPGTDLPACVYEGFFTQPVSTFSTEMDVTAVQSIAGEVVAELSSATVLSFEVDTTLEDFSDVSEWSISGSSAGTVESSSEIAFAGTSSIVHVADSGIINATISKTYSTPLDMSQAGGQIAYLSAFVGPIAMNAAQQVEGIPSHPGNLLSLTVTLTDGSGNSREFEFVKEELVEGPNLLPLILNFYEGGSNPVDWDASDVVELSFTMHPVPTLPLDAGAGWDDLYFGRLHVLHEQATYRPSRAKIELEDIDNVGPNSLYGSKLIFTDRFGNQQVFTGSATHNAFDSFQSSSVHTAYSPFNYKVISGGPGAVGSTEGFNRVETGLNLKTELSRQLTEISKITSVNEAESHVDVFTRQFSPTGDRKLLTFSNSFEGPDLIDVTGFSGGTSGFHEPLVGGLGSSLAQRFLTTGTLTLKHLELFLYRIGDPVGSIAVSIHEGSGGRPGNLVERAENLLATDIGEEAPDYTIFRMNSDTVLDASTFYWIVVSGDPIYVEENDLSQNRIIWSKQTGGYSQPRAKTTEDLVFGTSTGFWELNASEHHYFKVIGTS